MVSAVPENLKTAVRKYHVSVVTTPAEDDVFFTIDVPFVKKVSEPSVFADHYYPSQP